MNIKRILLISLIMAILISLNSCRPELDTEEVEALQEAVREAVRESMSTQYDRAYEEVVSAIKIQEGFVSRPYRCPAGVRTIGYGHAINKGEVFSVPMTRYEADRLVRQDLNKAINYVRRNTDLKHYQLLAIGHFVYGLGIGNFEKSTLKHRIASNQSIDYEIMRWVYYKSTRGYYVRSDNLRKCRQMELNLYKREYERTYSSSGTNRNR